MNGKRWQRCLFLIGLLCVFCGCGRKKSETPEAEKAQTEAEPTKAQAEEELVYRACKSLKGSYTIIGRGSRRECEDPLCWTDEAGDVTLSTYENAGTPYDTEGLLFDETYFSCERAGKYVGGSGYDGDGGGKSYSYWRLHALQPGETVVMILTRYLMDDTYLGTRYCISIDEDLVCRIKWIESDEENVHFIYNRPEEEE